MRGGLGQGVETFEGLPTRKSSLPYILISEPLRIHKNLARAEVPRGESCYMHDVIGWLEIVSTL